MECTGQYERPYLVIKGVPNIVYYRVYRDLVFSLLAVLGCVFLLALANHEDDNSYWSPRISMPLIIVALAIFILRIPVAFYIEIGNQTENLRLLWLRLVVQIITIGMGIILTILALLISDYDNKLDFLVLLPFFSVSPIQLTAILWKRIKQIKINSDAETNTA